MGRRFRFVRVLKWAGTFVCLLILAAFVASAWYTVGYTHPQVMFGFAKGSLSVYYVTPPYRYAGATTDLVARAHAFDLSEAGNSFAQYSDGMFNKLSVPLWLPFLIALAPTFLLWRLDRRRVPAGHCRECRYDLTGNTTGRCPECGAAFAPGAR